jgi:nuclear receptor interaction protein
MTGHPYNPLLAVSGIDHTVKIFSPEGVGKGLHSRQSLQDEYKILSKNDVSRKSRLGRTFFAPDMLEALAFNIHAGRRARGEDDPEGGCETM